MLKYQKLLMIVFSSLFIVGCSSLTPAKELILVKDGKPTAAIIIAEKPTKAAQLAAAELQEHVKLITGAELPIVTDDKSVKGKKIYVGDSKFVTDQGITNDKLKKQEYEIRFLDDAIILKGKDKEDFGKVNYRVVAKHSKNKKLTYDCSSWPGWWDEKGTLTATYDFLKKFCGVRWFSCNDYGTDYPETKTLTVKGKSIKRAPAFSFRSVYTYINLEDYDGVCGLWHKKSDGYKEYEKAAFEKSLVEFPNAFVYRVYAKRNMAKAYLYRNLVGGEKFGANHSMYDYYQRYWKKNPKNPSVFKGEHPKWFAQDSMRQGRPTQLCYTNPEVIEQVKDDANGWFEGRALNPHSGTLIKNNQRNKYWGENFFAVVPMDNSSWCRCPNCQKEIEPPPEKKMFSNGTASNYIWGFVNKIAKSLKKKHPDKKIAALAYASYALYPDKIKLEDNIAVQLCLHARAVYARHILKNDWEILEKWRGKEKNRSLYLWLYYCFPTENCNRTKNPNTWHCFPGFFAHYIGSSFKKYYESGVKGAFFNGFGQDVEAYVTFAMLDDPYQDVDELLEDYFTRMYGPAGKPLKKLYNRIEEIYCNPENYPVDRPGHQNEIYAWSFLGTIDRMNELQKIMDQAKKAIAKANDIQKKRFKLFELGTWDYMVKGKERFQKRMRAWYGVKHVFCPVMLIEKADGNVDKVNWADAQSLNRWMSRYAEGTRRKIHGEIIHDDQYLYLKIDELNVAKKLVSSKDITNGDYWQILVADKKGENLHELLIAPDGSFQALVDNKKVTLWKDAVKTIQSDQKDGVWTVKLALPLSKLLSKGKKPGDTFLLNIVRRSGKSDDQPAYCQTFGPFKNTKRFSRIIIDARNKTIPETTKVSDKGLLGRWSFEGDEDIAKDSSPKENHGKLVGKIKKVKGPFGQALELKIDRGGQYVEIEKPKGFGDLKSFTVNAWVNTEPLWSHRQPTYYTVVSGFGGMHVDIRPVGRPWFMAPGADKKPFYHQAFNRTLTPDKWEFMTITYDGKIMNLYVNGRLIGRGKKGQIVWNKEHKFFRIGTNIGKHNHFQFRGKLDEVELYNRALTPGEILTKYETGLKNIKE